MLPFNCDVLYLYSTTKYLPPFLNTQSIPSFVLVSAYVVYLENIKSNVILIIFYKLNSFSIEDIRTSLIIGYFDFMTDPQLEKLLNSESQTKICNALISGKTPPFCAFKVSVTASKNGCVEVTSTSSPLSNVSFQTSSETWIKIINYMKFFLW